MVPGGPTTLPLKCCTNGPVSTTSDVDDPVAPRWAVLQLGRESFATMQQQHCLTDKAGLRRHLSHSVPMAHGMAWRQCEAASQERGRLLGTHSMSDGAVSVLSRGALTTPCWSLLGRAALLASCKLGANRPSGAALLSKTQPHPSNLYRNLWLNQHP